jgi:hypothetical protein
MALRRASLGLLVILRVYARRMFGKELHDLTREGGELLVERLFHRHKNVLMKYYDEGVKRMGIDPRRHFHVRGQSLFSDDTIPA